MIARYLVPSQVARSVTDLDPEQLRAAGVRGVILDLDNTLVAWDAAAPTPGVRRWVADLQRAGLAACIVSNGFTPRLTTIAAALELPVVGTAVKPAPWGLRRAMRLMHTTPAQTVLVGDQLFTDVLGGNLLGLHTVLVEPLSTKEFVTTRIVRRLERLLRGRMVAAASATRAPRKR